ncbi:hypothetical protein, partial [Stutzerimonas nitrititolerans]|uniref:hypothetical protein n=1 Tax=Stutzerimonas nitrititolerans TaxID=2482751 RepID=UPI002896B7BB
FGAGRQYFLHWAKKIFSLREYSDFLFTSSAEPPRAWLHMLGFAGVRVVAAITSVENAAQFPHPTD